MLHRRGLLLAAVAAALAMAAGPKAEAALGDFTYTTDITPATLPAGGAPPLTSITQAGAAPTGTFSAVGGTDVGAGTVTVSNVAGFGPLTDTYNTPITLAITITDVASGTSGTVTFNGTFMATISESAGGVTSATFTNPGFTPSPQSIVLGGVTYTVTADITKDFQSPGAPPGTAGSSSVGGYSLHVSAVPEPASMALLGLGSLGAFGAFRRRRKA